MDINVKKTKYVSRKADGRNTGCSIVLRDRNGHSQDISSLPPKTSIRYLGLWLNIELNWEDQTARLKKLVMMFYSRIRYKTFTPLQYIY